MRSPRNVTKISYQASRRLAEKVSTMGARGPVTPEQLAAALQASCARAGIADTSCEDVLLLALTPSAYSSNDTADTPGSQAFISPAQVRLSHNTGGRCHGMSTGCTTSPAQVTHQLEITVLS
jgi:hypothetical protein